jgi:hypothetical protein
MTSSAVAVVAEVAVDRGPVAGAGVGERQGAAAVPGVLLEPLRPHLIDLGRSLAVPQLAEVEVDGPTFVVDVLGPPEQDVAGRLHQPLSSHDPLAGAVVAARSGVGLEHGAVASLNWRNSGTP